MTETKRPRGRPRKHPLPATRSKTVAPDWAPETGMAPVLLGEAYPPSEPLMVLGDEPISVIVHFKVALSQPGIEELVEWPRGWPLPQQNDLVRLGPHFGYVTNITYDLSGKTLHVNTRG